MLIVQKFGGSSLADAERIRRCADLIAKKRELGHSIAAVLSARGDTTDMLLDDAKEISARPPKRELDVLLSTGELGSVSLMAMQLDAMGIPAVSLSGRQAGICTDAIHGSARIVNINTRRILRELAANRVVLVAGFQGINAEDDITTLGRGGSDTTAVALAAALKADRCEIYSDVDGVYTADPRLVTGARKLSRVDFEDMLRLARGGSQVLHSRSVETAMEHRVPLLLLSSFAEKEGTLVSSFAERPALCGVTRDKAADTISLVGRAADTTVLTEAVSVLSENGIPVESGAICEGVCSVTVPGEYVLPALQLLHRHFFAL